MFQVYFIISSNSSPRSEFQDKITLHNNIFEKKKEKIHQNMFIHSKILIILKYLKTLILYFDII